MIKWIDSKQITAYGASFFKKINEIAKIIFIDLRNVHNKVGNATIRMGKKCTLERFVVHIIHRFAGKIIEIVQIIFIFLDLKFDTRAFDL
ncbi:hypothetical protein KBTX_04547 [wastewater metagenome]|uniref:Uncharacterized protein n=2 Tax=unclassified sequences TaxID=12908 RepID=A0A5B8RM62_9ZZZZ|nr:hypothetical protein KBTEX_04547 [uncultured organism]